MELILVDDGSRDKSAEIINELHARDPRVRGSASHATLAFRSLFLAGLDMARGDAVILIDADLQTRLKSSRHDRQVA